MQKKLHAAINSKNKGNAAADRTAKWALETLEEQHPTLHQALQASYELAIKDNVNADTAEEDVMIATGQAMSL